MLLARYARCAATNTAGDVGRRESRMNEGRFLVSLDNWLLPGTKVKARFCLRLLAIIILKKYCPTS